MTKNMDTEQIKYAITIDTINEAVNRIKDKVHCTPVFTCSALNAIATKQAKKQVRLYFKCENLQKVGAFKYRGAINAVLKTKENALLHKSDASNDTLTFVTHSSGNHGQALALAAKEAGCQAQIVMPHNSPVVKQNAVEGYNAQIVFCEPTIEDREATAKECTSKTSGYFIHPSNNVDVMNGQGTVAVELLDQIKTEYPGVHLDAVVVPIGGGGLCAGVAMAVKSLSPATAVIGIEPSGAADSYNSFQSKQLKGHTTPPNTVADGLRSVLGDLNWPVIRDFVDDIVLVDDDEIVSTMKLMWERMKLVVEPSGAVATAGVLSNKLRLVSDRDILHIGVVISGGNIDLKKLPWMK